MKRDKLLGLMILIVFCLAACGAGVEQSAEPERTHNLWTRACVVVEVNGDSVVAEDSVGHRWGFTDTEEYWEVGDGCSLLLDDNGTQEIYDDIIMGADFYRVDILNDVSAAGGGSLVARYKPGDRVIIRSDLVPNGARYHMFDNHAVSNSVSPDMAEMGGQVFAIKKVTDFGQYKLKGDPGLWNWTDEMFEGPAVELDDIDIDVCVSSLI